MNKIVAAGLALLSLGSTGCTDLANSVLFVTDTKIAIDADSKPPNVNIGYSRDETFIGPNFEGETGAIPPVVGQLKSNLAVFSPQIEQIYATGRAATLVTTDSGTISQPGVLAPGEQKKLVLFRTGANVGLKVVFSGNVPESFTFGYKRKELSFIPLVRINESAESEAVKDVYGSVLAFISVNASASSPTDTSTGISQFFATGVAAEQLAKSNQSIRDAFQLIAGQAVARATFDSADPSVACVETWLNSDDGHPPELQDWWQGKGLSGFAVAQIGGKEFAQQRRAFIADKQIPCNP